VSIQRTTPQRISLIADDLFVHAKQTHDCVPHFLTAWIHVSVGVPDDFGVAVKSKAA
jgi:hypothetical protein